jgi:hypothetical protein
MAGTGSDAKRTRKEHELNTMEHEIQQIADMIHETAGADLVVVLIQKGRDKYSITTGDALSSATLTLDAAAEVARVIKDGLGSPRL